VAARLVARAVMRGVRARPHAHAGHASGTGAGAAAVGALREVLQRAAVRQRAVSQAGSLSERGVRSPACCVPCDREWRCALDFKA
jgi:hypothetical protein